MISIPKGICLFSVKCFQNSKFLTNGHFLLNKCIYNCYCASELSRAKRSNLGTIKPQTVKPDGSGALVGEELAGKLKKGEVVSVINKFLDRDELVDLAAEKGLEGEMFHNVKSSFQEFCNEVGQLPTDLHVLLCDLLNGQGHVLDLFPFFLQHASLVYPHLKYKEELSMTGDLTNPAIWYPVARSMPRRIIFHYGPTNSGKTHSAIKRFLEAERAVYCAPLKLLAREIYDRANDHGVPCDLLTGEDKKKVLADGQDANHVSCTVEMVSVTETYDVAIIDEIQMLKDSSRGHAWTRALLGVAAKEIHLCGEESALNYIQVIAKKLSESLELHKYERLTTLTLEKRALNTFNNIKDGDCIVCFSRKDLFHITSTLEKLKIKCAVIYGTLPPGTKKNQTRHFNDPNNDCNVLVATDAIGLGLNLNIRRIIFYSIQKMREPISVSHALQIAGRAGRYQSRYEQGYITAFREKDLVILKGLLQSTPEEVTQAGLCPTAEQIEMFSFYLPGLDLSQLLDIFTSLSKVDDSLYFICDLTGIKRLADMIKHLPLTIKTVYTFCSAPVNMNSTMAQTLFVRFAKKFSLNEVITDKFLKKFLNWPKKLPKTVQDLIHLEEAFDCLDMYLWFSNRFPNFFPNYEEVIALQNELDLVIMKGVHEVHIMNNYDQDSFTECKPNQRIEDTLIQRGILSHAILAELKNEWMNETQDRSKESLKKKKDKSNSS